MKSMEVPKKFLKNRKQSYHMIWQSHSWAYIQRKTQSEKIHVTPVFISALITTPKTWKQPKHPSTED